MTPEAMKTIIRQMNDAAWHERDLQKAYEPYAEKIVFYRPPFPPVEGKEANIAGDEGMLAAFTDTHLTIEELVVEGDTAIAHWRWQATHSGISPSLGVPATGKMIDLAGCSIYHFQDGKIVEQWEYSDLLGLLQQVGALPELA